MMRQEGAEPKVYEMFYRAVEQAVLILISKTWVISEEMERKVEGGHTFFLRQTTRTRAGRISGRT